MPLDRNMQFAGVAAAMDDSHPSTEEVQDYLATLADSHGLPPEFVRAVARTESGFAADKVGMKPPTDSNVFDPHGKAYGVMQVNESQIGKTVRDADGMPFEIGQDVKTDWKANADAGVALLARHYQLAALEQPFATMEERSQQAYSGYSAGNAWRDRYQQTLPYNGLPAHPDDRAFLLNLRQMADRVEDSDQISQGPQKPLNAPPSQQQPASKQPVAASPALSSSTPLPGPLQRLKENPGDTFVQTPPTLLQRPSAFAQSSGQASDATQRKPEPTSFQPFPKSSLANVARWLFSPQQGTAEQSSSLPASLQQLKDNPGNTFVQTPAALLQPPPNFAQTSASTVLSRPGLEFIARHEAQPNGQPALTVYPDIYYNPTIGYGHVVKPGEDFSRGITEEQAMDLLLHDTRAAQAFVNRHLGGIVTQSEYDALVSVAFNSPQAALRLINQRNSSPAVGIEDFINTLPHGTESPRGLINRRTDEATLYLHGNNYLRPQQ